MTERLSVVAPQRFGQSHQPWVLAVSFIALAGGLRRFHLTTAYDVFIDEISYLRVSQGVARNFSLTLYGRPFLIHPPGFFLVEGAYLKLFHVTGHDLDQILAVRHLNVGLSALTAALIFAVGYSVSGCTAGCVAAALFAADPYLIRISSWNMLEPLALLLAITGVLVLARAIHRDSVRWQSAMGAGVAFGCALLTKETSIFITLVPCGIMFLTGWSIRRRYGAMILGAASGTYAIYPLVLFCTGTIGPWIDEKSYDLARLLGAIQETGFNEPGTQTLWTAIQRNISIMGASYALLLFGALATLVLLFDRRPVQRYLTILMVCTGAFIGYAILWGTLEEQMFFLLAVPSTIAIAVAAVSLHERLSGRGSLRRNVGIGLAACAISYLAFSGVTWCHIHLTPDTTMIDLIRWTENQSLPENSSIAVTGEPPEFLIKSYQTGKWVTPNELRQNDAHYVLNMSKQIEGGYTFADSGFLQWVARHGQVVWKGDDRTYGKVRLYYIKDLSAI